jgi:hypothetical protein
MSTRTDKSCDGVTVNHFLWRFVPNFESEEKSACFSVLWWWWGEQNTGMGWGLSLELLQATRQVSLRDACESAGYEQ